VIFLGLPGILGKLVVELRSFVPDLLGFVQDVLQFEVALKLDFFNLVLFLKLGNLTNEFSFLAGAQDFGLLGEFKAVDVFPQGFD